jgi:tRNA(fMet)-specific endonuclease VapC
MRILLDTDVTSAIARDRMPPLLIDRMAEVAQEDTFICATTVREVLYGLRRRTGLEWIEDRFEQLVARAEVVLPFDMAAARICADLEALLEAQGQRIDLSDLEIASIALANNLALITGNTRHFRRIPGLRVYNWLDA